MKYMFLKTLMSFMFFYCFLFVRFTSASAIVDIAPSRTVSEQEIRYAVKAVRRVTNYMQDNYGEILTNNVRIYLHRKGDAVSSAFEGNVDSNDEGGQAVLGQISINLPENANEYYITFIISHEMVHQYQMMDTGVNTLNRNLWFVEGMADLIGTRVANEVDASMFNRFVENAFLQTKKHPIGLYSITTRDGWKKNYEKGEKTYAKADLVLIYLTTRFPDSYMFKYMFALADSSPEEALQSVYGINSMADLDIELEGLRRMRYGK